MTALSVLSVATKVGVVFSGLSALLPQAYMTPNCSACFRSVVAASHQSYLEQGIKCLV